MRIYRYYSKLVGSPPVRTGLTPVSQSCSTYKVSDDSGIETSLVPVQDTTVYATGHYYVSLDTGRYSTDTLYKAVWTFELTAGTTQTATEYFTLTHVAGPIPVESSFLAILTQTVNVYRPTDNVLDATTPAASLTPDRDPAETGHLIVRLDHASAAAGSITIAGSTTETISVTSGNREFLSTRQFSSVSGMTTGGITGGTIQVEALDRTGNPILQEILLVSGLSVYWWHPIGRSGEGLDVIARGVEDQQRSRFMCLAGTGIKADDVVYASLGVAGLTRGRIELVDSIYDFDGNIHHLEAEVESL